MSLNANIKSLKLGCGGVNGAGCDNDNDNVSLSGSDACVGGRPNCDAVMIRPFVEFAIKNHGTLSTREIMGVRFGAESLLGFLTTGTNNGTANGINSFSGYMKIASSQGTTATLANNFTDAFSGNAKIWGCIVGCPHTFNTRNEPLVIPSLGVNFNTLITDVEGSRLSSATINATSNLPNIPISDPGSGFRSANMSGCFIVVILPLCNYNIDKIFIDAQITGLKANITIDENLGLLHKIPLNNHVSLSLQKTGVLWPNAPSVERTGWYLGGKTLLTWVI